MKTLILSLVVIVFMTIFSSCEDGKKVIVQEKVHSFSAYIDSVSQVATNEASKNWQVIESDYEKMKTDIESTIETVKEDSELEESMDESTLKYETFKAEVMAENERMETAKSKMMMRQSLLGNGFSGDDMTFTWINKDNILSVYQNFVDTVSENKDAYSREDWDEIKLLYEAIDTRKNTVEKEGLTSSDNRKIAGLKLKFAPMYTFNRMGAKSDENAAAKK